MTIELVPFEHISLDFSLREITTSKGETVAFCQIEANTLLDYQNRSLGDFYSWGRVVERMKPFEIICGGFIFLLIKDCCGDMGVFALSHAVPESGDPVFQALVYEGDELIVVKCSDVTINLKTSWCFVWFNANQRLQIETIPDFETYDALRKTIQDKRKGKGDDTTE